MAELQLVGFRQGLEEYVVDIIKVKEIMKMTEVTKIAEARHGVEGVINLRGSVIPILNLGEILGIDSNDAISREDKKIIVIEYNEKLTGMVVDSVTEVIRLDSKFIDPTPEIVSDIDKNKIRGVGKISDERLIIILDIEKILKERSMLS